MGRRRVPSVTLIIKSEVKNVCVGERGGGMIIV